MSERVTTTSVSPQPLEMPEAQDGIEELAGRIAGVVREDGGLEPLKGLHLHRVSAPKAPLHSVYKPAFCVIAQGSKEVFLGDERYQYDPAHYLLVTAELPTVSHVLTATKEKPYLSLRLDLEPTLVGSVLLEAAHSPSQNQTALRAVAVSALDAGLLDAVLRLVRLLDSPKDAPFSHRS